MGEARTPWRRATQVAVVWPYSFALVAVVACGLIATAGPPASGQPSESASPSESPSPSSSSGRAGRTVQLETRRDRVLSSREIALRGVVGSPDQDCSTHQSVEIKRRVHGTGPNYDKFRRTTTNSGARFSIEVRARRSADYLAVLHASGGCRRGLSDPIQVLALVRVRVRVDDRTPERSANFRIFGRVLPAHSGTKVVLERQKGNKWRRDSQHRSQFLGTRSTFSYFVHASWRGTRVFRIRWRKADHDHEANASRPLEITTHS